MIFEYNSYLQFWWYVLSLALTSPVSGVLFLTLVYEIGIIWDIFLQYRSMGDPIEYVEKIPDNVVFLNNFR